MLCRRLAAFSPLSLLPLRDIDDGSPAEGGNQLCRSRPEHADDIDDGRHLQILQDQSADPRRESKENADDACSKRPDGYSLLVRSSLFRFFFVLYTHRIREESLPPSPYEDAIKQVLLYVQNHFSEPITVSDAASLIDYSDAHFMRVFRRETGFTFGEYLSDYRLRYASYLLRERPDSVGAIASLCGFDNFSYFIRRFRRKYGMSPREYRSHGRQNTKSP